MKKDKKTKFNFAEIGGSVVGGVVGGVADEYVPVEDSMAKSAIVAAAGVAIGMFVGGDLAKGVSNGMIAVASSKLAADLIGGDEKEGENNSVSGTLPSQSAIGMLPSQSAIGMLPSQSAIGRLRENRFRGRVMPVNKIPSKKSSIQ